jgi:iron complex outermembrane receptor protein
VTRGSKGPGFGGQYQPDFAEAMPYGKETLTNYEIGAKGSLFDGKAFLSGALFYYDYQDYQAFVFSGLAQRVLNIDNTKVIGSEIELQASPMEGLDVILGASFLFKAKANDVLLPDGSFADRHLPMAPDVTLNGILRYSWSLPWGVATVQGDASYTDDVNFSILNHETTKGEGYALFNARVSLAAEDDRWEIAGFVKNLTNKRNQVYALDVSSFSFTQAQFGRPRWWGIELSYRFN